MHSTFITRNALATMLVALVALAWLWTMPRERALALTEEDGPFEIATAVVLVGGAGVCLAAWCRAPAGRRWNSTWLAGSVVMLAMGLRELDFHKRYTTRTISSTRFFISNQVPIVEKVVVVALLALVALALIRLIVVARRHAAEAWRTRSPWLGYLMLATVWVVVSRVVEKTHIPALYLLEEVGELVFAILLCWMILDLRGRTRSE